MIKLLIVDDHPMILEGSKKLFNDVVDIFVDTLEDIQSFAQVIEETAYDVFFIDVNLGANSGLTLVETVKEKSPSSIVILYTGDNIEHYYSLIVEKKIDNIIPKTASKERILKIVYAALNDDILLPKSFMDYVNVRVSGSAKKKVLQLNQREKKILELVREGHTNQAIALELSLSQRTIENNLSQIYLLLNVGSRAEAVIKAKELELI